MHSTLRRLLGALAAFAALTLLVAACGDDDDDDGAQSGETVDEEGDSTDEPDDGDGEGDDAPEDDDEETLEARLAGVQSVDVVATQETAEDGSTSYSFAPLEGLTAGPARFNLVNEGTEAHHVQLFQLGEGTTMDDVGAALATGDPGQLLQIGAFVGGTGVADPGSESVADALIGLEEGTYVMLCFVEGPDGLPHLALGMVQPFEVGPADGDAVAMPEPDLTVGMVDFGYDTDELPASGIVEVVNESETQLHELNLLALADGATADDVFAFFTGEAEGPPPFSGIGGMQAVMPGGSHLLVLDGVSPGDHLFICLIPDPADGVPHAQKGMAVPGSIG